ncbi:c-type cytochrome [Methyloceanibacter sp.]|uniref:c-type cytochrome n=1 Tax=Methyloceanibacter sp. TaxID=1965321 RepID=UPI002D2EB8B1|nr:c-type cytochrome [Methyloceanibacter sp.]HZP08904.1 c-type cytochrome [Methyloceanibacter sp.]
MTAMQDQQLASLIMMLAALLVAGCGDGEKGKEALASQARGAALIAKLGCGACHTVPGIEGATALVGPPLDHMGSRLYIAGVLRNTPDNMILWLRKPQSAVPGNAMPDMDLDEKQARDIAAYLASLK